jgi:hypothetical protein
MHIPHYIILVRVNRRFHISQRHPLFLFSLSLFVVSAKLWGNHQTERKSSVISGTKIIIIKKES